jgi:hypothetical protein
MMSSSCKDFFQKRHPCQDRRFYCDQLCRNALPLQKLGKGISEDERFVQIQGGYALLQEP